MFPDRAGVLQMRRNQPVSEVTPKHRFRFRTGGMSGCNGSSNISTTGVISYGRSLVAAHSRVESAGGHWGTLGQPGGGCCLLSTGCIFPAWSPSGCRGAVAQTPSHPQRLASARKGWWWQTLLPPTQRALTLMHAGLSWCGSSSGLPLLRRCKHGVVGG